MFPLPWWEGIGRGSMYSQKGGVSYEKGVFVLVAALALGSLAVRGFAEGDIAKEGKDKKAECSQKGRGKKKHNIQKKLAMLTKKLNLTADQQAQVQAILENSKKEVKAVWEEAKAKTKEINKSVHDKIAGTLTAEQKEQFKPVRADCEREQKGKKEKIE